MANARLTLRNSGGQVVHYGLNVISYTTGVSMQISKAQLHFYAASRPIRIQQRAVTFTAEWSSDEYERMEELSDLLRGHHMYALRVGLPEPMVWEYFPSSLTYYGYIEAADKGDERHKAKYSRSYQIRLMNKNSELTSALLQGGQPNVPTPAGIEANAQDWYGSADLSLELSSQMGVFGGYWAKILNSKISNGSLGTPGGGTGGNVTSPASGADGLLTIDQVAKLALDVGFNHDDAATAVSIAKRESHFNPKAHNPVPPDDSYGLWQINMLEPLGTARKAQFGIQGSPGHYEALFDPATNAKALKKVWESAGNSWTPWTTYTGSPFSFTEKDEAIKAVARASGGS